ncbi:MAG: SDR family NAD(P)-dependent oxidoreductase [Microthrixaceae bacterium]
MDRFTGKVVAITGAGSGIGRALATELSRRGAHLALSDVDEVGLEQTRDRCGRVGVNVGADLVDVADRTAVERWAASVVAEHGRCNIIVNNAGVALGATVESMSYEDLDWLMSINFWGVVHGTKAFLPHLKATGDGHVVNVSSVFGFIGIPTQSAYNAAKFAVRGFTESLRIELDAERCGVSATCVHPGGIKTNIARSARMDESVAELRADTDIGSEFERVALTTPDRAARSILHAVERNRRRALIGPDAVVFDAVAHLPAAVGQRLIGLGARRLFAATSKSRASGSSGAATAGASTPAAGAARAGGGPDAAGRAGRPHGG